MLWGKRDVSCVLLDAVDESRAVKHGAVLRGVDVDQPRNLAKSVTVE